MDVTSATNLARKLTLFAAGKMTAKQFLTEFHDVVGQAYIRALDKRSIERIMSADFLSFRNPHVAGGFNKYSALVKVGRKGRTRHADPIDWTIRRGSRSRFALELQNELGPRWKEILKRSRMNDVRLKPMSSSELAHYDRLAGRVEDYRSLAKLNEKHGKFFEVDHILEQRFWRNDPRVELAFNEASEGIAMLVPRNPAIAAKMPGNTIAYVHTTK